MCAVGAPATVWPPAPSTRKERDCPVWDQLNMLKWLVRSPFRTVEVNPSLRRQIETRDPAGRSYGIFFTPRSGSTWFTDLMTRHGLGQPAELFNPQHMAPFAQDAQAATLADYLRLLPRQRQAGGLFGFKLTYLHVLMTFRSETRFFRAFPDTTWIWLVREDIVAQAISGSRVHQTGIAQLRGAQVDTVTDAAFHYRPSELRRRIKRLRWLETRTEGFFARRGLSPCRLSYERLQQAGETATAKFIASMLKAEPFDTPPEGRFHRVASQKAPEFAARFRDENAAFVERIDAQRASMLAQLQSP